MLTHAVRRLLPAVLLALPVLGGLWATSGPAPLAASWPFPTPACSPAQAALGTGSESASGNGTVFFGPGTGAGALFPGGVEHDFVHGGMSWNFTTQATNDATGNGSMTASLRVVVNGVPGIGTLTFTSQCLLLSGVQSLFPGEFYAVLYLQGTATGFGPVTAKFVSGHGVFSPTSQTVTALELFPLGNVCQTRSTLLLRAEAFGGQATVMLSGSFQGFPVMARYVSTLAPCERASSPHAGGQQSGGILPLPPPIALP